MEDEDEVDVLGDFCLNLETDLNHYDTAEFPAPNSELLGDYMQHPWLLDSSQAWYYDHGNDEKNKGTLDSMLHEEKKHFPGGASAAAVLNAAPSLSVPKVSPLWSKDDIELLVNGIELHRNNWGKVARTVGTKTTLQVKSYIKSHPELITNPPAANLTSGTPSPPQYVREVEITDAESTVQFSPDDIVNEAEIPASMEEVIASVAATPSSWGWPTKRKWKKSNHPTVKSIAKTLKRGKGLPLRKKILGRPKKLLQKLVSSLPVETVPAPLKKTVPVLEGEIIRLQKEGGMDDSKSDSEVDIDGDDDNCDVPPERNPTPVKLDKESCSEEPLRLAAPVETVPETAQPLETLPESAEYESKSECESSETDSKCNQTKTATTTATTGATAAADEPQPVFTFPVPAEERTVDVISITDEEKTIHWDFFEGRPSKTPERYMKIRNSIIQEWKRVKPRYLTKTSVRPSLKNCGDVNCISRIHAYLELTGAINFGCDQLVYERPLPPVPCHRERLANSNAIHMVNQNASIQNLLVRARKKRQIPPEANVFDADGGYTISHDGSHSEIVASTVSKSVKQPRKSSKQLQQAADPFQLVPCTAFTNDKKAPFEVKLAAQALIVIDVHCHLCTTEVIGLLGGHFCSQSDQSPATLYIEAAQPCRSQATNHQCEMCPVSQTEGYEVLRSRGLDVVGWYHSHPTFPALPSQRDVHTQSEFQQWFSRQDAPFIGLIVNPFSTSGIKSSLSPKSMIRCITVHDGRPYKHQMVIASESNCLEGVQATLGVLETNLDSCPTLVPLDRQYPHLPTRPDCTRMNYAKKIVLSLRAHLESVVAAETMTEIESTAEEFLQRFVSVTRRPEQEEEEEALADDP